jgi:hypothetical protein
MFQDLQGFWVGDWACCMLLCVWCQSLFPCCVKSNDEPAACFPPYTNMHLLLLLLLLLLVSPVSILHPQLTVMSVAPIISVLMMSLMKQPAKKVAGELARVSKITISKVSHLSSG